MLVVETWKDVVSSQDVHQVLLHSPSQAQQIANGVVGFHGNIQTHLSSEQWADLWNGQHFKPSEIPGREQKSYTTLGVRASSEEADNTHSSIW